VCTGASLGRNGTRGSTVRRSLSDREPFDLRGLVNFCGHHSMTRRSATIEVSSERDGAAPVLVGNTAVREPN
jgi:hypothetical protein